MNAAERIFEIAKTLPEQAQEILLRVAEGLNRECQPEAKTSLSSRETLELRAKLAAWENDWTAPGMEAYDRVWISE